MTKRKNTKKILITSIISLIGLIGIFMGTTFAWFTDSESSGKNKIQSGNLDIKLEYSKTLAAGSWQKVTTSTDDIFTDLAGEDMLWEPGATSVVYLKVSNAGTLALKYNLGVNIVSELGSINVDGENFKLSDYIQIGQVELEEGAVAFADAAAARNALAESVKVSENYTMTGNLLKNKERIIALVLYMPLEVGNKVNYRTGETAPEIQLGLNLLASQFTYETDSFDKYYDSSAPALESATVTAEVVSGEKTHLKINNFTEIVVPTTAKANGEALTEGDILTLKVEKEDEVPGNYVMVTDEGTTTYDISLENQNGAKIVSNGDKFTVTLFVGEANITKLTHIKNNVPEVLTFTKNGEYITFETDSFSPFVVTNKYVAKVDDTLYESIQDALDNAHNGERVVILSDYVFLNCETTPLKYHATNKDINGSIDLNGHTISAYVNNTHSIDLLNISGASGTGTATMTITDTSKDMTGTMKLTPLVESDAWKVSVATLKVEKNGRLFINSGNFINSIPANGADNPYGIDVQTNGGDKSAELTINGGYIESKAPTGMAIRLFGNSNTAGGVAKVTVNGGTIVGAPDGRGIWLQNSGSTTVSYIDVTINGGIVRADRALEIGDFYKDTTDATKSENISLVLNGGKFESTNLGGNLTHPNCPDLYTSMSEEYYNRSFNHIKVTDNRSR